MNAFPFPLTVHALYPEWQEGENMKTALGFGARRVPFNQSKHFLMRARKRVSPGRLGATRVSGEERSASGSLRLPPGWEEQGLGHPQQNPKAKISSSEVKPSSGPWGGEGGIRRKEPD